jgi:glyoxylase-like metal-dependent hydrolase (beta-lactamase superfamily II)
MKNRFLKILLIAGIILVVIIAAGAIYLYPSYRFFFQEKSIALDKDLTILLGGGGNTGILITDSAVVVIDTKMGGGGEKLYNLAKEKAGNRKIMVINTHYHGDHVKGNRYFKGCPIYIGNYDTSFLRSEIGEEDQPDIFVKDSLILNLGRENVLLLDMGRAHTFHDMVVFLENRKVLFTGDLIFHNVNPVLMQKSGTDVDLWINVLSRIIARFPSATYVPGHGVIGTKSMAESLKQYFLDMKAAASDSSLEKSLVEKYRDWQELPMMASPGKTIDYIRNTEGGK